MINILSECCLQDKNLNRFYKNFCVILFSEESSPVVEPPPKKAKKIPKILDGKYYTIISNDESTNKVTATCVDCGELKKGCLSSTENFKSHFEKRHKARFKLLEEYLNAESNDITDNKNTKSAQPSIRDSLAPVPVEKVLYKL